jgi:hypothetical protein
MMLANFLCFDMKIPTGTPIPIEKGRDKPIIFR